MDLNQLKQFILEASQNTYASEDKDIRKKQDDNSTTIIYENGDWKYHDNYFGGEPYGGREVVFYENIPVWIMVYYGRVTEDNDSDEVYKVLTNALRNSNIDMPYRGPKELIEGEYRYENEQEGEVDNFSGEEKIYKNNILVYSARYMGGLVDVDRS
jgi:hypothetical protein